VPFWLSPGTLASAPCCTSRLCLMELTRMALLRTPGRYTTSHPARFSTGRGLAAFSMYRNPGKLAAPAVDCCHFTYTITSTNAPRLQAFRNPRPAITQRRRVPVALSIPTHCSVQFRQRNVHALCRTICLPPRPQLCFWLFSSS